MSLNAKTIQVLKNFSQINQSIRVKPGSQLETISPSKTIFATAKIETNFEDGFAVYDLPRFLGVLSLFDNPEMKINEGKTITILGKNGDSINYTCADPSNIVTPPDKELKLPSVEVNFTLKEEDLSKGLKALSVLSLSEIAITGDGEKVYLQALDSKNPTGDVYKNPIGNTDKDFRFVFRSDNLKLLPGDYEVSVCSKGMAEFKGDPVTYFVAIETDSSSFNS